MWLFNGRYAQFGPIICVIAVVTLVIGNIFLISAVRLARRSDLVALFVTAAAAVVFGYSSGFGEPVFVGNGSLNRGAALFVAILGALLGVGGALLIRRLRLARMLALIAGGGILLGDVAGWIHRSSAPSKYDYPIGQLVSRPYHWPL